MPGTRRWSAFKPALMPDGRYIPIGHEGYGRSGSRVFGLLPHFFALMFLARFARAALHHMMSDELRGKVVLTVA